MKHHLIATLTITYREALELDSVLARALRDNEENIVRMTGEHDADYRDVLIREGARLRSIVSALDAATATPAMRLISEDTL